MTLPPNYVGPHAHTRDPDQVMRLVLLLIAVALVAGCTVHPARDGQLVQKYKVDAWTETWTQMVCVGFNAQGVCTVWVPIVHTTPHPQSWWVTLHSDKAIKQGKEKGRGVYADWPIRYDMWLRLEPGQHVHVDHSDEAAH